MKRLAPLLLLALLMGQDCEAPDKPNVEGSGFCYGNDYSVTESISESFDSIMGGIPSTDRRATVYVWIGTGGYCSGVALGPRVVLTAGHCGYGTDTVHHVRLGEYGDYAYKATKHVVHPDYMDWVHSGSTDFEARKADLMLLFFDEDIPGPYADGFYVQSVMAPSCRGGVAQGWGRHETLCDDGANKDLICETDDDCPGSTCVNGGQNLRETKYVITRWDDPKYLRSVAYEVQGYCVDGAGEPTGLPCREQSQCPESQHCVPRDSGKICFGDSGGPLYMDVDGMLMLAGITTTTMSSDCMAGGTHVAAEFFKPWIVQTIADNANEETL